MTLQEQINAASSGATITLPDGSEHVGNFVVDKPLTIQGNARLRSPNADPTLYLPPKTGPVNLVGLEVTHTTQIYDIIRSGDWQTSVLSDVPQGLSIDSCDIHGLPDQESQRGIAANCANFSIKNSKVREIHGKGYDTQAICSWNGPGPFKIIDTYLEASGENVMFGGADARIPNLVPSGIEIRRCRVVKPLAWRGVWSAKNLIEIKMGRNIIIDGNILENSWGDAQIGWGVLFTVRNQDGTNPWAVVEDISFTNNTMSNVAGGFQLLGLDYLNPSLQSSRLRIANNLINIAPAGTMGPNGRLIMVQQFDDVTFENNEGNPSHTFLILTGADSAGSPYLVKNLVYRNNLVPYGEYGLFGDGGKPYTYYAPDGVVTGNVIYGPAYDQLPGNTYLDSKPSPVPDGVGVDMAALLAAQAGTVITPPPTPTPPATPPRKVVWPTTEAGQNSVLVEQWADRYRMKRNLTGKFAEFEYVP